MKLLLGLLIVGGGIAAALHYSGMFNHNPAAQAKEVQAKMEKCKTLAQVLAVAEPRKYCIYVKKSHTLPDGSVIETWNPGPQVPYDKDALQARIDNGSLEGGFAFFYTYTDMDRFEVKFDPTGGVEYVQTDDRVRNLFDM
ncbi:MAG TPA: hypothetical protein P5572_05375 [Phycisphaerae bacterium]|nr:hypothetical protein [Phycisphaerae bacterium]